MSLTKYIKIIGEREEIRNNPPVLVDIGASGELNPLWKSIAGFCIGVAFDADDRDFTYEEKANTIYKKLYTINRIVVDKTDTGELPFHLTKKPHCSSLLPPDPIGLEPYDFASYFELDKVVPLKVVALSDTLEQLGITQVDWFKTDSQGTDLRLYKSLPDEIRTRCLIAEFEPGHVDAYQGEDKLVDLMDYMRRQPYYLGQIIIKGPLFIKESVFNKLFPSNFSKKIARHSVSIEVGWAELIYINKMNTDQFGIREFLIGWLFTTILSKNGHAHAIALEGSKRYNDLLLKDLVVFSEKRLKREPYTSKGLKRLFNFAWDKFFLSTAMVLAICISTIMC